MSKLSSYSNKELTETRKYKDSSVENFMGGTSYELTPLNTLKIVAASSIFGEPQYYRDGLGSPKNLETLSFYSIFDDLYSSSKSAVEIFENSIDESLDYNFKETLDLALDLRNNYYMRLNPAVIFIRASIHRNRSKFNENNPGYMKSIGKKIAGRPDDLTNQFDYYMYKKGSKSKILWLKELGQKD